MGAAVHLRVSWTFLRPLVFHLGIETYYGEQGFAVTAFILGFLKNSASWFITNNKCCQPVVHMLLHTACVHLYALLAKHGTSALEFRAFESTFRLFVFANIVRPIYLLSNLLSCLC